MKRNIVQKLIQECIKEVLTEATGSITLSQKNPNARNPNYLKQYTQQGLNVNISETEEIDEMARIGSKYKLGDNYEDALDKLDPAIKKSKARWIEGIIEWLKKKEGGEDSIVGISQGQFQKPQQAIFMLVTKELVPAGVLQPTSGEAVAKHDTFVQKKQDAEEKGEEFNKEDALDHEWANELPMKFQDFFKGDSPDEMAVGPGFSDDFGTPPVDTPHHNPESQSDEDEYFENPTWSEPFGGTTLFTGEPQLGRKKSTPTTTTKLGASDARMKAAEWFSDDANDRLLSRLISMQANAKLKGGLSERRFKLKEGEDGTISASDLTSSEKRRIANDKNSIDSKIQEFVDRIKLEDPDVQRAIIDMLEYKLPGHNQNLYKKIKKALGLPPAEDVVAAKQRAQAKAEREKVEDPIASEDDIEDIVGSEEDVYNSDDLPVDDIDDEPLKEEECDCEDREPLAEELQRLQVLAGIIKG